MKKLGKLVLVLALIVATLSSSLLVARAEPITDEVDDSTIINDDGGGTGSGGSGSSHTHNWRYCRFYWYGWNDEVSAEVEYTCYNCPDANTDTGYRVEHVKAEVKEENGVYTATISKSRALDHTARSDSHKHKWQFDGFEWEMTDDGLKAYGYYHCTKKFELDPCRAKREIQATVTDIKSQPCMCMAVIPEEQSPDGDKHYEYYNKLHPVHEWIFDGFVWDFSEHDWQTNTGVKIYALYYCRFDRNEQCRVLTKFVAAVTPLFAVAQAHITETDSLDNEAHVAYSLFAIPHVSDSEMQQWIFARYDWTFEGFEWDMTDSVKAYAVFRCEKLKDTDLEYVKIEATVTGSGSGTVIHTYEAVVSAELTPDKKEYSEIKSLHIFDFIGFEWDLTNFTAKALFECFCGEQHKVDAEMSYPNGNHAKAYVSQYVTPDHTAHEETREVDFGDYLPYTWEIGAVYEFKGFEWDGYKAYACYDHYKRVGCGTFSKETVKVEAVVTRLSYTVAPQYRARIAAWQTPDGVEHTEVKTIVIPPNPPVGPKPIIDDGIIAPPVKREINPGLHPIIVSPIFTPVNP